MSLTFTSTIRVGIVPYNDSDTSGIHTVPVGDGSSYLLRYIRKLDVGAVKAGDIFKVSGRFQVANNLTYWVESLGFMTADNGQLTDSYNDSTPLGYGIPYDSDATSGAFIGRNIHHDYGHYHDISLGDILYVVPADADKLVFRMWYRARAPEGNGTTNIDVSYTQQWLTATKQ